MLLGFFLSKKKEEREGARDRDATFLCQPGVPITSSHSGIQWPF